MALISTIFLAIYAIIMIAIGVTSAKKAKNMDAFLLGGRKTGAWMSAFAYGTSYFSAVIFVGYAGKFGWDIGLAAMWTGIGNAIIGCLLGWWLLAKKTRKITHKLNAKTMPEFFFKRYNSTGMKIFAAIIIFVFLVPYSSAVYNGITSIFSVVFTDVQPWTIMLAVAVLSSIYLALGGYLSATRTDFIQGIIMIVGICLMMFVLVSNDKVGGLQNGISLLKEYGEADGVNLLSPWGGDNWRFLATNILLTSVGAWGLPHMINKFYAVKEGKAIKTATIVSTGFALLIGVGTYFAGSLGRIFLDNTLPAGGYDMIVPNMLIAALGGTNLFSSIVFGIILLLLLSASMSTLSGMVLISSSAISVDLLSVVAPDYNKNKQLWLTRILCVVFVAASYFFATCKISLIVNIMSFSWGVIAGCFIGPYLWGVLWKRTNKYGAWAGFICGFLTVAVLTVIKTISAGAFSAAIANASIYGVLAMFVSFAVTPLVTIITEKKAGA